jgi:peptidase M28-like protein
LSFALLTLLALTGPPAVAPQPIDPNVEERIAARVSRDEALAAVRELVACGPRMGGTASGRCASAAVSQRLRALGLQVEAIDEDPIDTHEESAWSVRLGDRTLASAWPYGFSPSLPATTGRLVIEDGDASRAAEHAARGDLKGAFVLTAGLIEGIYAAVASGGAVALLTDLPADPNRFVEGGPIGEIPRASRNGPRIPVFALSYRDGRLLRDAQAQADAGTSPSVTAALTSVIGRGGPRTILGTLPGAGSRAEAILLVCAHGDSDSGGPGADDNASGVAALMEVARALSWASREGLLPSDRTTVRFAVWGAEYHSSESYVTTRTDDVRHLEAVVNFDQAGTGAERDALYFEGNNIPWNEPLLRTLEAVAQEHAGKPGFWKDYTSNPALGGTDAYSFLPGRYRGLGLTKRKIPATTVFTSAWDRPTRVAQTPGWRSKGWPEQGDLFIDYSAFYHSSADTPANTTEAEPYNIERCARLVALGLRRLMASARR